MFGFIRQIKDSGVEVILTENLQPQHLKYLLRTAQYRASGVCNQGHLLTFLKILAKETETRRFIIKEKDKSNEFFYMSDLEILIPEARIKIVDKGIVEGCSRITAIVMDKKYTKLFNSFMQFAKITAHLFGNAMIILFENEINSPDGKTIMMAGNKGISLMYDSEGLMQIVMSAKLAKENIFRAFGLEKEFITLKDYVAKAGIKRVKNIIITEIDKPTYIPKTKQVIIPFSTNRG